MTAETTSKISGAFISPIHRARIYTVVAAYADAGLSVRTALDALTVSYEPLADRKEPLLAIRHALASVHEGKQTEDAALLHALVKAFKTDLPEEQAIIAATKLVTTDKFGQLLLSATKSLYGALAHDSRRQ